ncbi:hypothetical protein [Methanosarcina barkeri]|uniref:hypothetical protein n=1 Tax=Methanosarcina barkeri TaxID=2208 RepID=UPI0018B07109|nr:hypothetical protein [Methanosarcina barkeri]
MTIMVILHTGRENMKPCPETRKPGSSRHCKEEACNCPSGRLVITDNIKRKTIEPEVKVQDN